MNFYLNEDLKNIFLQLKFNSGFVEQEFLNNKKLVVATLSFAHRLEYIFIKRKNKMFYLKNFSIAKMKNNFFF